MRIDLHTHSTASDGTDDPADLIGKAAAAGLDVVALTDHDTTAGWAAAEAARPAGLALVRGMELSCVGEGEDGRPVPVHLLAYLFDPTAPAFAQERARLRTERVERFRAMAAKMQADGLPIDADAILATVGPAPGRPHLARALVTAGVVSSIDEAFAGPLADGGRYYVDKADTPLDRAVQMVATAGGVAVIAHPRARRRARLLSVEHIRRLAGAGLSGLEIDHPDHLPADRGMLTELADELDLIRTGSSDYHGDNKTVRLGEYRTAAEQYERIVDRATGVPVIA
ncbi:PHP domain-containing protein [Skermania piniformis]|uniref:PHP domain-containing protein n=1 Tax=Skermania pinensis TaxID=39122 RepID=A0ABX8S9G2_9ACTN|nr:PHP domain-containing protein [Skermania piniformis]QXQ13125.1 PHP domain-containing protein [Skermania piniformis]